MIVEMVTVMEAEQGEDDSKKAYRFKGFDVAEDEAEAVQKSTFELDASVAKGTEIRHKQPSEFVTLTAINAAATELLKFAVNRLNNSMHTSCARLHRRRSSAQRIVSTTTWEARSPPLLPLALEARTSLGCTCCRLFLLPSLPPPSSRKTA